MLYAYTAYDFPSQRNLLFIIEKVDFDYVSDKTQFLPLSSRKPRTKAAFTQATDFTTVKIGIQGSHKKTGMAL
ncbi:hypothetical protein Pan241w_56090 [Gimesia alba]|uniref:Uncharacterized protein n=1 Tax=Gimesia alba TaxID=2527973 RepID=A0A517RNQ8_9PLAN|nr:hypothetical protein Pan241w_56090 [Gimesia alba]